MWLTECAKGCGRGTSMLDERSPVPKAALGHHLAPNRCFGKGAATPFIVHGHRLSSLYRALRESEITFIVLKILKSLRFHFPFWFEYLRNNEMQTGPTYA